MRNLIFCLMFLFVACNPAWAVAGPNKNMAVKILNAATGTGAGEIHEPFGTSWTIQATGTTSAGAGSSTTQIQLSDDGVNFVLFCTITLTLSTTSSTDACAIDAAWRYVRANVTAISGTGAQTTVWLANQGR